LECDRCHFSDLVASIDILGDRIDRKHCAVALYFSRRFLRRKKHMKWIGKAPHYGRRSGVIHLASGNGAATVAA